MDAVLAHRARDSALAGWLGRPDPAKLASWGLGFALPCYLALRGGGYEAALREQIGIALWWIVALGALVGVLPAGRPSRGQLLMLAALLAFAAWTALGALWSQSSGRTIGELASLSTYAAVLTLAAIGVRTHTRAWLAGGVASATALIALLALLSRLHPAWFPADETARFLPGAASRLNYPLNYWNALAAFVALGVPLVLHFAVAARALALRALAAAALVVMGATVYLTLSRGGVAEVAAGLLVVLVLAPDRPWRLAALALAAIGTGTLILAIHERPAIERGLTGTAAARHGGGELIAVALVVCASVALLQTALGLAQRHARTAGALGRSSRRPTAAWVAPAAWGALVAVAVAAFLLAGGAHELASAWREFKSLHARVAEDGQPTVARLATISGNGRYQYWVSALHAFSGDPIGGIGAGTFQFWWAAHGSIYSYVVNAHSLYFETLAETGIVGAVLLALALAGGVAILARRWRRARSEERALLAALLGACAAFLLAAGVDWVWQIPAVPVAFLLLLGTGATGAADARGVGRFHSSGARARAGWVALAAIGAGAIFAPLAAEVSLRESRAQAVVRGRLPDALADAGDAVSWQPYAAAGPLQQALVLEQARNFTAASAAARRAARAQSTDWSIWLVLSRIEAERGDARAAVADYRRARALDPHDPIFARR